MFNIFDIANIIKQIAVIAFKTFSKEIILVYTILIIYINTNN